MIALAALFLAFQAAAPAQAPAGDTPPMPWSKLPDLPLIRHSAMAPEISRFVHDEVAAGRCNAAQPAAEGFRLHLDLALLVDHTGEIKRIIPHAIGCPTVEQYSAGIVSRMARANVAPPESETWYRAGLDFSWKE
ncbi:hypothetical protein [uncultured Sphingomonas sp.]|uniref:hypothetical protein n=1 Tax=uncultured Sphingomonas sp. TaxID=158754 RepID=UPI00260A3ADD|nr:hypothetical protein [uncultured Sphingomonas sp.]